MRKADEQVNYEIMNYRIYSNTIRILFKPAPLIEPAVVLSKFPIIPAAKRAFHEIEPADCNRINTVYVSYIRTLLS